MRYLEDFTPGEIIELGSKTVSEEEILTFAREFDPQPFHIDPERARDSVYGGIIASGWHTIAIFMRLAVDGLFNDTISMGSPGVNEVRWLRPVRPWRYPPRAPHDRRDDPFAQPRRSRHDALPGRGF